MFSIQLHNLSFGYPDQESRLFNNLTLDIGLNWKLGVVGRNGLGKSTLLSLIEGSESAQGGSVSIHSRLSFFPQSNRDYKGLVRDFLFNKVGNFANLEKEMDLCLNDDLERYFEIQEHLSDQGYYELESKLLSSFSQIGLESNVLERQFEGLSGGEKTKVLLVALFEASDFVILDEPCTHLDARGREHLRAFLNSKKGYLLVSHDRELLKGTTDHILHLRSKGSCELFRGGFEDFEEALVVRDLHEERQRVNLEREVRSLKRSALEKKSWSFRREGEKKGAYDKGFIGARAARMMKRSKSIQARMEKSLQSRQDLLAHHSKSRSLKLEVDSAGFSSKQGCILDVRNLSLAWPDQEPFQKQLSFQVFRGERVGLAGPNGSGKSSLIHALMNQELPLCPEGQIIWSSSNLRVSQSSQSPRWTKGLLADHLEQAEGDYTGIYEILGCLGVGHGVLQKPLELLSDGERRKVDLAGSLLDKADLWIWDEPLTNLDMNSRDQLAQLILEFEPTLLIVEHDESFLRRVCDRRICLK